MSDGFRTRWGDCHAARCATACASMRSVHYCPGRRAPLRTRGDPTRHMPAWLRRDRLALFLQSDARFAWKHAYDGPLWWRHLAHLMTTGRPARRVHRPSRSRPRADDAPPCRCRSVGARAADTSRAGLRPNQSVARPRQRQRRPPRRVRLAAKKSNLRPFYNQMLSGPDLAPIRLLLEPPDARIYEYVDRGRMRELLQRPLSPGQEPPGWARTGPRRSG